MWSQSFVRSMSTVRIFIRPKIVLFLSLITLFFLLVNWSKEPEMLKAHVNLKEIKRVISFPRGDTVQGLRYLIIRDYSDLLLDTVPPACVQIQQWDETVSDDIDLPIQLKLEEDVKVKVKLPATQEEMASCGLKGSYISIPWTLLNAASSNSYPIKFHSIKANVSYRLWSPVYGGSLLRRTRPNNVVDCGGAFSNGMDYDTVMISMSTGEEFAFIFKDNAGKDADQYVLDAKSKDQLVATKVKNPSAKDLPSTMKFIPDYYWSFTVFKNKYYDSLYLGCNGSGTAFMVPMNSTNYPDARSLFISNKYVVKMTI